MNDKITVTRRDFMKKAAATIAAATICSDYSNSSEEKLGEKSTAIVRTVLGDIKADELGLTLVHEHIMCDFIGADKTGKHRYKPDEVFEVILPYLKQVKELGVKSFVDCTPMYIGRDPEILARLSKATGLNILTNTGLYKEPFLPQYAFDLSEAQLADIWIKEVEAGIEDTRIKAGFIKIAVNPGPLIPIQQKIVRAACRTHKATKATVACHTANGMAALEEIDIFESEKVDPANLIIVHADAEKDQSYHFEIAKRGAWVEFDGISQNSADRELKIISDMVGKGYENKLLISQDAGWYNVGQERGGKVRAYDYLVGEFVPLMSEKGFSQALIDKLLIENPAKAFRFDSL